MSRFWRRVIRRSALVVSAAVLINLGTQSAPPQLLSAPAHIDWSAMVSWAESEAKAVFPASASGSAGGLPHSATSGSTRAGHGRGSAPGKGAGALPAYSAKPAVVGQGTSGRGFVGFNAKTSKFDTSRSSADISVFDNADGSITKHVSQSAVNFKNAQGKWQQIDTSLVRAGTGALRDGANSFAVTFSGGRGEQPQSAGLTREDADPSVSPSSSSSATATPSGSGSASASPSASGATTSPTPSASIADGSSTGDLATVDLSSSESFAWSLQGAAQVTPTVSGDTATYTDVLPDTTLQLSDQAWGVRELFVLSSAQAGNSWTFPLSMTGVSLSQASDGTWELVDGSGNEAAYLDQPWAMDSNFDPVTGDSVRTQDVSYSLSTVGGVEELTMTLDSSWLDDSSRVFPVTVDPTVTITDGENAGTLTSTYADAYCSTNCITNNSDYMLKVGNDAGTGDLARSFVDFPAGDLVDQGEHVVSAQLAAFMFWTGNSTDLASNSTGDSSLEVGPLDSAIPTGTLQWTQSNCTGNTDCTGTNIPLMNTSSGDAAWTSADGWSSAASCSDIPSTQETNVNRWVYDDISDVSWFNAWQVGTSPYYGFFMAGVNDFNQDLTGGNSWKQFASANDTSCAPYLSITEDTEQAPTVSDMTPVANASLSTLTPTLRAVGSTADAWDPALEYDFTVYSGSTGAPVQDSGWLSTPTYAVKPGALSWGQTYTWRVQAYDGDPYGGHSSVSYNPFATVAPPPLLTDGLSQNTGGHGVDPAIGNYTTSATDAKVGGIGPSLEIDRDYNSLDPRISQALGAGWSSILDAKASQVLDGDGNLLEVVLTYPDGSQVPFGADAGGGYSPPQGTFGTVSYSSSGGYTLIDKQDTVYTFGQNITPSGQSAKVWGLTAVTNSQGQALTLSYASGRVSEMTGASQRHLFVTWQPAVGSGANYLHVASIATDPVSFDGSNPLTWNYEYSGDDLSGVCDPDGHCNSYGYEQGSEYDNAILDSAPTSYWTLDDGAATGPAASAVLANEQSDQGEYNQVGAEATGGSVAILEGGDPPNGTNPSPKAVGPLAGSQENVAVFGTDSADSSVDLQGTSLVGQTYLTVSLWFDASSAGPLLCEQDADLSGTPTAAVCPLYVGTDGKLHGGFYDGASTGMTGGATVVGTGWHQAVLEAGGSGQVLYLDGKQVASESGLADNLSMSDTYLGAGFNSTDWPDTSTTRGDWYFDGDMSNAGYWTAPLSGVQIANLYQIGTTATALLTSITNPVQAGLGASGVPGVQVAYDTSTGRVVDVWDGQGEYQLSVPTVTGSSQVFRSAVLGSGPGWYWPLGDSPGSQASDEVNAGAGTYSDVTLGAAGEFPDATAAAFNGSNSSLQLPSGILSNHFDVSVGLWFKATAAGGVLFSHNASALSAGTSSGNYQPWMYVGKDGKLVASIGTADSIETSGTVVGTGWHYALFTASNSSDSLYLDGSLVGTGTPHVDSVAENEVYVGAGFIGGSWPDEANNGATATPEYFDGSISDVAIWRSTVDSQTANSLYKAAENSKGITPTETVVVSDPGAGAVSIPFNGQSYAASADQTWKGTNTSLVFQTDGELEVVRNSTTGTATAATPLWSSGTPDCPTATLTLLNSGAMEIVCGFIVHWISPDLGTGADATGVLTPSGDFQIDSGMNRDAWDTGTNVPNATNVDTYEYDPLNGYRMIAHTDERGETTTYGYDTQGFLNTVTDPNGNVTTTEHDVRGNLVAKTTCQDTASDQCSTQYWTYAPNDTSAVLTASATNDQVLTYRDGNSNSSTDTTYETSYQYDNLGDPTVVTTPAVASESHSSSSGNYTAGSPAGLATTDEYTGEKLSNGTVVTSLDYVGNIIDVPNGLLLQSVSPGGGTTIYLYYANGDLATATTPDGETTLYTYDGVGRVSSKQVSWGTGGAMYPAALTTYQYNGEGQVTQELDPVVSDAVTGRTHQRETTNTYDPDGNLTRQVISDQGTGQDASRTTSWLYTPYDQVQSVTDPDQNETQYTYYPNGLKETVQDPELNVTEYQYDLDGDLTATILENYNGSASDDTTAGPLTEESLSYDPADRLASVTNAEGVTTDYTYYDNGLQASVTEVGAASTRLGSTTTPLTLVTESDTYDDAGNLLSKTTGNGTDTTTYAYDADNRVVTTTVDPNGTAQQVTTDTYFPDSTVATTTAMAQGTGRETAYTYDAGDYVLTSTLMGSGSPAATTYTRDPRGLATSVTDPDGDTTDYIYDALGRLTTTEQPGVSTTTFNPSTLTATTLPTSGNDAPIPETTVGYNTFGEQAELKDPDGNTTENFYDADGNLRETTLDGGYTPVIGSGTASTVQEIRTYTPDGQLYQDTDPDGDTTTYAYDQFGDETSVQDPVNGSAHPTTLTYDKAGEQTGEQTPAGTETSTAYDGLGRVDATSIYEYVTNTTNTTNYTYNRAGQVQQVTSPLGVTNSYTYDDIGEQATVTDGAGNPTDYAYDGFGDVSEITYPDKVVTYESYNDLGEQMGSATYGPNSMLLTSSSLGYDQDGRITSETDALDDTETFNYYPTGWLKNEIQPVNSNANDSITVSYGYDLDGNTTASADGNGQSTYWTYNGLGLPDTKTVPATAGASGTTDQTTDYAYDADGQLTAENQPGGVDQDYGYDANGDLLTATGSGASATTTPARVYTYDADGHVTSARTCTTTACSTMLTGENFGWNNENEVISASVSGDAGEDSTLSYNQDGQLASETTAASTTPTIYTYDTAGRLQTVSDPLTGTTDTYTYTDMDQVGTISYGAGALRTYGYNQLGEPTSDKLTQGSTTLGQIQYGYDQAEELTSKTDQDGTANTYGYDEAGRLTSWDTPTTDTAYTYDDDSNRTAITSTSVATASVTNTVANQYDARDELTASTTTPASGTASTTDYTYTADGTLATAGSTAATFDAFGDQTTYGTDSYTYDALGRAATQTNTTVGQGSTSTTTDLAYVGATSLLTNDGNADTYTYDPDGAPVAASANGASVDLWTDQHSDVVGDFTPSSTALLGTTEYDPLGNVTAQSGNAGSISLGYQSGYTATGQVNMGSRWYSPSTGQFTSADTVSNSATPNPANANPFGYANASPLNGTDPTGHYDVGGGGYSDDVAAILEALGVPPADVDPTPNVDPNGDDEDGSDTDGTVSYEDTATVDEQTYAAEMNWRMGGVTAYDQQWRAAHPNSSGWLDTSGWPGSGSPSGPGPDSGVNGGGWGQPGTTTRPAAPVCDAACQFRIHLHQLQNLSVQGRGKNTAGKATVRPKTTGADSKGPVLGVVTNDTGNDNPGGAGYTAGATGYWLDSSGNYVSMADGTIYCGPGNSTDCQLGSFNFGAYSADCGGTYYVVAGSVCGNDEDLLDEFNVTPGNGLDLNTPSAVGGKSYITYVAVDETGAVRYVGRASGNGTPLGVMAGRIARGHDIFKENPGFRAVVIATQLSMLASQGAEGFFYEAYLEQGAGLLNDTDSPPLGFSKPGRVLKSLDKMDEFFNELLG